MLCVKVEMRKSEREREDRGEEGGREGGSEREERSKRDIMICKSKIL